MRDDTPSLTAIYVAFARAIATRDHELAQACSDPCAEALLPRALRRVVQQAAHAPLYCDALRRLSFGLIDHLALRTALIDGAVEHAATHQLASAAPHVERRGSEQLVLLGAGFDSRAHRMKSLGDTVVFEVDHPATQSVKRRKAKQLPVLARELRYAACDFQRTHLEDALANVGFDPSARSTWVWEGVTMYLPPAAVTDSLSTISRLSVAESVLVTTYLTPQLVAGGALLGRWSKGLLGIISEPVRFSREASEIADILRHADFDVLSDALPIEAAPHFGVHVKRPTSFMPKERIVVAIKGAPA